MDQFKEILGVVKRQHFWFIAPILLALGVTGGMMASKQLSSEFDSSKQKVTGYLNQMQGVSSTEQHPNKEFEEGMATLIRDRRDNVKKAWEAKWTRQKQELAWPQDLPADFHSKVESMRPIEKVDPANNVNHRIPASLRRSYGAFIESELPRLAQQIGARWQPTSKGRQNAEFSSFRQPTRETRTGDGTPADAVDESQIVIWNPENQGLIKSRFDWGTKAPSTFEVLYAQEDLWVLGTLIDIIKRTNNNAQTHSQAAVKEIEFIQIGKDVQPSTFQVTVPQPLGSEDSSEDVPDFPTGEMPEPSGTGETSLNESGDPVETVSAGPLADLVANRYVDENYQPIADLNALMTKVTVAKRIPVRLRIEMDHRYSNRLLVECANSRLTFEVRQLRFNPSQDEFGAGGISSRENSRFSGGSTDVKELEDYQSFDRTVELFGIVYIFNPVDDGVLGITSDDTLTADAGSSVQR